LTVRPFPYLLLPVFWSTRNRARRREPGDKTRAALTWLTRQSPYLRRLGVIKHGFCAQQVTRYLLSPRRLVLKDFTAFLAAMGHG
jgi:hypothetical protein